MKKVFSKIFGFVKQAKTPLIVLVSLLATVFATMGVAYATQSDFGNVNVETGSFVHKLLDSNDEVEIGYKLYIPKTATATNKAPAVLCLHGYQNDHETSDAYAIEAARRGAVALAVDLYGHGSTNTGMVSRGYTNHKVTVSYGYDVDGVSYLEIGSQTRYKVMMNFSNLAFFADRYSKNTDFATMTSTEGGLRDSSMGGIAAYEYLSNLPYVDSTRMAITGHSMGTWASWSVAAYYSGKPNMPRATVLQCGELFKGLRDSEGRFAYDQDGDGIADISFNNVLLLTAKYDEFNYFRDYISTPVFKDTIKDEQSLNFLGVSANEAEFSKTFHEDFAKGTSVRREYIVTNHRLTTHDKHAVATTMDWFDNSISFTKKLDSTNQIFQLKEIMVLIAMFAAIASTLAIMMVVANFAWFKPVFAGVNSENKIAREKEGWKWWKGALIMMGLSAVTYPFMTQLGHGLMPLPEKVFSMTIGNGFMMWYVLLIVTMLCFIIIPRISHKSKRAKGIDVPADLTFAEMGLARDDDAHRNKFDWALLGKSALVVLISIAWMYLQLAICEAAFGLDFRFIWPFFKTFTLPRFGQFFVYIAFFATFFILNNSRIFASNTVKGTHEKGFVNFLKVWWKYALCMAGGVIILVLLEYIPFFLQLGPGADLLFSSTFGGPFMSLLIVFLPQILVFSVLCTFCYKKTGNAFVGALLVATMACWIVTGGSAMLII